MISPLTQVQILNKKVDVSKVTSKCGSKDNIKYKPGQCQSLLSLNSILLHAGLILTSFFLPQVEVM